MNRSPEDAKAASPLGTGDAASVHVFSEQGGIDSPPVGGAINETRPRYTQRGQVGHDDVFRTDGVYREARADVAAFPAQPDAWPDAPIAHRVMLVAVRGLLGLEPMTDAEAAEEIGCGVDDIALARIRFLRMQGNCSYLDAAIRTAKRFAEIPSLEQIKSCASPRARLGLEIKLAAISLWLRSELRSPEQLAREIGCTEAALSRARIEFEKWLDGRTAMEFSGPTVAAEERDAA